MAGIDANCLVISNQDIIIEYFSKIRDKNTK
jgi:hypothetical protein